MSPQELPLKLAEWRQAQADGTITREQTKEFIAYLRGNRFSAGQAAASAAKTRKRAVAEIPSADDMLSDLGDL